MKIAIAHAGFLPERAATLERLMRDLEPTYGALTPEPRAFVSTKREHASVWARRLWEYADNDAVVCLNDDVRVCPDFANVCEAMVRTRPDRVIALHTTAPVAPSVLMSEARWITSYWLTGPGYILPAGAARRLLAFADAHPSLAAGVNEDNLIMHWAWHEQSPIWHCLPAIVEHDTGVPSSLGYDNHPGRVTNVPWRSHPGIDLLGWEDRHPALLVECPWMTRERLRAVEFALETEPGACTFCFERGGVARSTTGAAICGPCLARIVGTLAQGASRG